MSITYIIDKRSSCARTASVTTVIYRPGGAPAPRQGDYFGSVVVHPEYELIVGTTPEKPMAFWNNADLAVIRLEKPVASDVQPVVLPSSEVRMGDAFVMAGYGHASDGESAGPRRFGENRVTRIIRYATGNVLFGGTVPPGSENDAGSRVQHGDSGGAAVSEGNPKALIGIVSMTIQTETGAHISYFTSAFSNRPWLLAMMRPASDAGSTSAPPPADR